MSKDTPSVYATRVHRDWQAVDAHAWDALLAAQAHPHPFWQWAHLKALRDSGSAVESTGWCEHILTLSDDQGLAAACVLYLKSHSRGEFVFDWAWADAHERFGLPYYPKWVSAVPFTPVPGARLLARDAQAREALARALTDWVDASGLSSAHVLMLSADDEAALSRAGWLVRDGVQFHWQRPEGLGPCTLDDHLWSLRREKRKNIRQERRRVAEAGVQVEVLRGTEIKEHHWAFFDRCHDTTYAAHGSRPYLKPDFFRQTQATWGAQWWMAWAHREGRPVAVALLVDDVDNRVLYGRHWGCVEAVDCLHFEACYYRPLDWALAHGYRRFEGGAQGVHKMARGLMPVRTASAHWIREPRLRAAIEQAVQREAQQVDTFVDDLKDRSPYKPLGPTLTAGA